MNQTIKSFIQNNVREKLNIQASFYNPKGATKKAKEHFGNRKITVAEIGVYEGDNVKSLFKHLNISKLYGIDHYGDYIQKEGGVIINSIQNKKIEETMKWRLKKLLGRMELIRLTSDAAVDVLPDDIDFIYIDGNHDYEYVKRDLENYFLKVKKGGMLAGNDIQYLSVACAVVEFANKYNLDLEFYKFDWIIKKRK